MSAPDHDQNDWVSEALIEARAAMLRTIRAVKKMYDAYKFGATKEQIADAVGRPIDCVRIRIKQRDLSTRFKRKVT